MRKQFEFKFSCFNTNHLTEWIESVVVTVLANSESEALKKVRSLIDRQQYQLREIEEV